MGDAPVLHIDRPEVKLRIVGRGDLPASLLPSRLSFQGRVAVQHGEIQGQLKGAPLGLTYPAAVCPSVGGHDECWIADRIPLVRSVGRRQQSDELFEPRVAP